MRKSDAATSEEIVALANRVISNGDVAVENGKAVYYHSFDCEDGGEPGDVAWDRLCSDSESLNTVGLVIVNSGNDNDSVWGDVVVDSYSAIFTHTQPQRGGWPTSGRRPPWPR